MSIVVAGLTPTAPPGTPVPAAAMTKRSALVGLSVQAVLLPVAAVPTPPGSGRPPLRLGQWNGTRWVLARERGSSGAQAAAIRRVTAVADAQLDQGPFSVTFAPAAGFVPGE